MSCLFAVFIFEMQIEIQRDLSKILPARGDHEGPKGAKNEILKRERRLKLGSDRPNGEKDGTGLRRDSWRGLFPSARIRIGRDASREIFWDMSKIKPITAEIQDCNRRDSIAEV